MSNINDGGPAFPIAGEQWDQDGMEYRPIIEPGMSLRDWFAGQALPCIDPANVKDYELRRLFGEMKNNVTGPEIAAAMAYEVADAMLARRSRRRS